MSVVVEVYEPHSKRRWLKDQGKAVVRSTKRFFKAIDEWLPAIEPGIYEDSEEGRL
jgi:hypothetical protein